MKSALCAGQYKICLQKDIDNWLTFNMENFV